VYYVRLNSYFFYKKENTLFLTTLKSDTLSFLSSFFQIFNKISKKILILKGLGLKIFFNNKTRSLEFKLGYSHILILKVDKEIFVGIKKNIIFLQSLNKEKLGNFSFKIKNLRHPDCYRGKGIWYKNEKIKMKQVKKK
jgi:large subunit ribosomal protein L6